MQKINNEALIKKVEKALMNIIKTNVANEEFKLPPEDILCEKLGISRTVLRDALSHLQALGYILRKRSKGTIINKYVISTGVRIDLDCEVEDIIFDHYDSFEYSDIEIYEIEADEEHMQQLKVHRGEPLMLIKKKYKVKGEVVAFDTEVFPKRIILTEYDMSDFTKPIYQFFEEKCKINIEILVSHISAQEYEGNLYLFIDEVGNNLLQIPILWSRQYYSSQHFKYLSLIRRKGM